MITYQWTAAVIAVVIAAKIFFLIRRDILRPGHAVSIRDPTGRAGFKLAGKATEHHAKASLGSPQS